MRRALLLARRGLGYVAPNPMVGCVIAKRGHIIGEGYHRRFGGPHAEIEALRACESDPCGATAYVTLEPCNHAGKTPPCVPALIKAGIGRVVVPLRDPNPRVNGTGVRALRKSGVTVDVGVLESEAAEVLAPFTTRIRLGRPYVIAKWAQAADGSLVTPPGRSRWISCELSRRLVHRLRARVDAIMVGVGTVLADDPLLTARSVRVRRTAKRVVLDGRLRIPTRCQLVTTADRFATVVITTRRAAQYPKADLLRRRGIEVVTCRSRADRMVLRDLLHSPIFHDATNLLVEGGPTLLNAMFAARLVDEAHVFVAPGEINPKTATDSRARRSRIHRVTFPTPMSTRRKRSGIDAFLRMTFNHPAIESQKR